MYANETVIYERTRALPRARWASRAWVLTDPGLRVQSLGYNRLPADEVILSAARAAAVGKPAEVHWVTDGLTEMVLSVRARGAGLSGTGRRHPERLEGNGGRPAGRPWWTPTTPSPLSRLRPASTRCASGIQQLWRSGMWITGVTALRCSSRRLGQTVRRRRRRVPH